MVHNIVRCISFSLELCTFGFGSFNFTKMDRAEMQKVIKIEYHFWPKKIAPKNGRKMTQNDPKQPKNDP